MTYALELWSPKSWACHNSSHSQITAQIHLRESSPRTYRLIYPLSDSHRNTNFTRSYNPDQPIVRVTYNSNKFSVI